jgi:hypothetical protein
MLVLLRSASTSPRSICAPARRRAPMHQNASGCIIHAKRDFPLIHLNSPANLLQGFTHYPLQNAASPARRRKTNPSHPAADASIPMRPNATQCDVYAKREISPAHLNTPAPPLVITSSPKYICLPPTSTAMVRGVLR